MLCFDNTQQPNQDKMQTLFQCTPREATIASDLMQGATNAKIAEQQSISIHTARQRIKHLMAKNGYNKQTELVTMMVRVLG